MGRITKLENAGNMGATVSDQIKQKLDITYLRQLPTICLVVFGYYSLITGMHFLALAPDVLLPVAGTSGTAAISALFTWWLIKRKKVSARLSHIVFIPTLVFILVTIYVHVLLSQEQHQLTNVALFQYALGLVTLSPLLFGAFTFVCTTTFVVALMLLPGSLTAHFAYMQFAVIVVSIMGFTLRYRAISRAERLLLETRRKTQRLAVANKQVQAKILEVEEANAARDAFLANITHELRTPLTGVMGVLDLMDDTGLNNEQTFLVDTAKKSAGFLLHIVNDLLDISKLEAGKLTLKPEPIDINLLSKDAVMTFKASAQAKKLMLSYAPKSNIPPLILGDSGRISQILLNLVNNAVKFTETGTVSVTLEYSKGNCIWVVCDTGCGIPREQQDRLFQRFEQIDSTATRTKGGSGLGLSIAKEITDLIGGTICVESEVGRGACFTLTLPLKSYINLPSGHTIEPSASDIPSLGHLKLRALAAEDNSVNQMLIKRIMDRLGINVTIVGNGKLAVEAVCNSEQPFDLIFMDVQMPEMDGVTATKLINEQQENPPPIIALTANTSEDDIALYKAAGMQHFVGKPFEMGEIYSAIMRCVP